MPYGSVSQYFIVIIAVVFGIFLFVQSKKMRKQQDLQRSFQENLKPGTLVITISGVIGKVVSVDTKYEEIVIDSEGTLLRVVFKAISREYVRPAFIEDDEENKENQDANESHDSSQDNNEQLDMQPAVESTSYNDAQEQVEHEDNTMLQDNASEDLDISSLQNEGEMDKKQPEYGQYAS